MVFLLKATLSDIDLLYEWANDHVVRENSFSTEPISYDTHVEWFNRIMTDDSVALYIMMERNIPVGQIRLNIDGNEAEISYSISANFRGKGYGRKILQLIADEVQRNFHHIKTLVAKVKPDNRSSRRLFESEGYDMKCVSYAMKINEGSTG